MAEITAALVRELRDETGLPMMDCKQALTDSWRRQGEAAKDDLREEGHQAAGEPRQPRDGVWPLWHLCRRRTRRPARSSS